MPLCTRLLWGGGNGLSSAPLSESACIKHHGDEQQWVNPFPSLLQGLMRTIKVAPRGVNKLAYPN